MTVTRVVPDLATPTMEASQRFYADVLARVPVHPLTDEPWGVRRSFVRDPAGHVVNVLVHG